MHFHFLLIGILYKQYIRLGFRNQSETRQLLVIFENLFIHLEICAAVAFKLHVDKLFDHVCNFGVQVEVIDIYRVVRMMLLKLLSSLQVVVFVVVSVMLKG